LSSVIPPGTRIELSSEPRPPAGEWGDRLYVVMAEMRSETPGEGAWAGIGWVQEEGSSKGLFVELRQDISSSLTGLCAGRPDRFGAQRALVHGAVCDGEPLCAMVVAVYESHPWRGPRTDVAHS